MIWPPKVSDACDPHTRAADIAARLYAVGRLELAEVHAAVPSAGHVYGGVPAVGSPLVAAAGFYGGCILPSADAACSPAGRACG